MSALGYYKWLKLKPTGIVVLIGKTLFKRFDYKKVTLLFKNTLAYFSEVFILQKV
jgi:hypothetical protein